MKLDRNYSLIKVCPVTGKSLTADEVQFSNTVCPQCGARFKSIYTHYSTIVGKWRRPTLIERFFEGKQKEFSRKEEEHTWKDPGKRKTRIESVTK